MSRPVIAVNPDTPVKEVAAILRDRAIGAVPVVDRERRLLGLVSETDLLALETITDMRRQATPEVVPSSSPETVGEIMSREVVWVEGGLDAGEAARLLTNRSLRHVPVVEDGRVAGMLSRRDLLGMLTRTDAEIESDVVDLLEAELGPRHPQVRVREGTLFIDLAADAEMLRPVEALVSSVPGIVAVKAEPFS